MTSIKCPVGGEAAEEQSVVEGAQQTPGCLRGAPAPGWHQPPPPQQLQAGSGPEEQGHHNCEI